MKRHLFTTIEEVKQAHTILNSGVLVAERNDRHFKVKLYQLTSGYIEVYFHSHFNVLIKANHFSDVNYLDEYLEAIDISALFN